MRSDLRDERSPIRRVRSHKYAAGILDRGDVHGRVLEVQNQVLRRIVVRKCDRLLDGGGLDDQALGDGLPDDVDAREGARLLVDLGLDGGDGSVVEGDGDEDNLRVYAVLRLGEEVGGDEGGVACLVRNNLREHRS